LLVLPINNSLLYVEPIFLEADRGGLPELARVIVVFGETVVMEETLERALIKIFGEMDALPPELDPEDLPVDIPADEEEFPPGPPVVGDAQVADLIRRAQDVYTEAQEKQREGDWAAYGELLVELEEILNELARLAP
jgi:hypothetical protein